jgi:hypothetical protein
MTDRGSLEYEQLTCRQMGYKHAKNRKGAKIAGNTSERNRAVKRSQIEASQCQ